MQYRSRATAIIGRCPGLSLAALALAASSATAQAPAAGPADPQGAAKDIIITGSRIVRDGYSQPSPVTVAPVAELQKATPTNLSDALNKLPQFSNSISPSANPQLQGNTGEHGNILNLRGVGGNRVLILLDGIRVPPTTFRGSVDSNTIPQLLIQRVDVVTAGASAAYGSDAVSGLVNYVLDTKLTGLKGVVQRGISTRGDLASYRIGLAGGLSFAEGRGHVVASAERFSSGGIDRAARHYGDDAYASVGSVPGSTSAPGTAANPLVFRSGLRTLANSFDGYITASTVPSLRTQIFQANGTLAPVVTGTLTGTPNTYVGGQGLYLPGNNTLIAPLTTTQGYARASYDLTDTLTAHVQGDYSRSTTTYHTQLQSVLGFTFFSGNAYLDPSVQARLGPNDTFTMFRLLRNLDPIPTREQTDSYLVNAGLDWKIGGWKAQLDYTHGDSITNFSQRQVRIPKLAAALDAVRDPAGNIVCRVTLTNPGLYPGCQPINVFGPATPNAQTFQTVLDYSRYRARNTTEDVVLTLGGDLFRLPAGPVSLALGAEYREQKLSLTSNSDPTVPLDTTGLRGIPTIRMTQFNNTNIAQSSGSLNVKEGFGEVAVPLLKDKRFAEELSLNAAARITDYSTSGGVKTWKVGGVWSPVRGVSFRVTRSRDIRAPALYDLYAGVQTATVILTDPHTLRTDSVRQFSGGNASLQPEKGDTLTGGIVLRPAFLPGFAMSIDYYKLRIKGAIATQGLNDVANECETSGGASPTCALITRPLGFADRSAANFPTSVRLVTQNIAFLRTSGVDVDLSYRRPVGSGNLTLRTYLNYLDTFVQKNNSIAPAIDYAGYGMNEQTGYARPKVKATISADYRIGGLGLFVQETILGRMKLDPLRVYAEPPVKAVYYTDATISYQFDAPGKPEMFVTATNLLDRKPPLVPAASTPGLLYPTLFQIYDVAGRTLTAGLRFRF